MKSDLRAVAFWAAWVLAAGFCACSAALAEGERSPATQPAGETWSVDDVVAAVEWREAALEQYCLEFTENLSVSEDGRPLNEHYRKHVKVFRRGDVTTVDLTYDYLAEMPSQRGSQRESWDGKVCRGVYRVFIGTKQDRLIAGVLVSKPAILEDETYCLRGLNLSSREYLSAKIRRLIDIHHSTAEVTVAEKDGEKVLTLVLLDPRENPPARWEFSFLPRKDFVLQRLSRRSLLTRWDDELTAGEFKQVDGLWAAMRVVKQGWSRLARGQTRSEYVDNYNLSESRVLAFSRAKPTDEQMDVTFPVGVLVEDAIARQKYRMMPDGSRKYEPMVDQTGKIIEPSASTRPASGSTGVTN